MTCGISTDFSMLSPTKGQVAHVLLTRSPLEPTPLAEDEPSLDLHVLGTPPALTLSQDQTLRPKTGTQGLSGPEPHGLIESFPLFSCQGAGPPIAGARVDHRPGWAYDLYHISPGVNPCPGAPPPSRGRPGGGRPIQTPRSPRRHSHPTKPSTGPSHLPRGGGTPPAGVGDPSRPRSGPARESRRPGSSSSGR